MDYKARAKSRKLKRKVTKFLNVLKFNSLNATSYHKVILIWCVIVLFGLFFTWVEVVWIQGIGKENGFSSLLWASWWIILILTLFIIFVLLSERTKEKLKLLFNISFKDYHPPIVGWSIMILMIVNSVVTMRALRTFSSEIVFGRWLFIAVSGTIIVILGWLSLKKHYDKNVKWIYSEIWEDGENIVIETKDNMKLPF